MQYIFNLFGLGMLLLGGGVSFGLNAIGLLERDSVAFNGLAGTVMVLVDLAYRFGVARPGYLKCPDELKSVLNHWLFSPTQGGMLMILPVWLGASLFGAISWAGGMNAVTRPSFESPAWTFVWAGLMGWSCWTLLGIWRQYRPRGMAMFLGLQMGVLAVVAFGFSVYLAGTLEKMGPVHVIVMWAIAGGMPLVLGLLHRDNKREEAYDEEHGKGAAHKAMGI